MICVCGKETQNPKYCSRGCAVRINNKLAPKRRKLGKICNRCSNPFIPNKRGQARCINCPKGRRRGATTLGALRDRAKECGWHPAWAYSVIRADARRLFGTSTDQCERCGYARQVQIAHRRAVSSFPNEATLDQINNADNILKLCPNHHWEYDHGGW